MTEYDAQAWPRKKERNYHLVPTTCFNCESACGLVAYIDKDNGQVQKLEGNPYHPGSRGRNCAKGPATINQLTDHDRILYPLKRKGERGGGEDEYAEYTPEYTTTEAGVEKEMIITIARRIGAFYAFKMKAWNIQKYRLFVGTSPLGVLLINV